MDVRDSGMAAVLQDLLPNNWVGQGLLRGERGLAVATRSRCSMPPIRSFEVATTSKLQWNTVDYCSVLGLDLARILQV